MFNRFVLIPIVVIFGFSRTGVGAVLVDPSIGTLELIATNSVTLDEVDGLAFDRFGNLFAGLEIDGPGNVVYIDKLTGSVTPLLSPGNLIDRADQIAFHPNGLLYVTSESRGPSSTTDRLFEVSINYSGQTPISAVASSVTTSLEIFGPEGLAVLPHSFGSAKAGDLIVGEDVADGKIFFVDPTTGVATELVGADAQLQRPEGLHFGDFAGALAPAIYVAETTDDNILQIDSSGNVSVFGNPAGIGLRDPDNVEFGPDGFMYVTEGIGGNIGRIIRIAADGTHSVIATGFDNPQGLAFDPFNGDLYIAEQADQSVWRIRFTNVAVPEPSSYFMFAIGMLGAIACGRTKRIRKRLPYDKGTSDKEAFENEHCL